jgi:hypothetical protein
LILLRRITAYPRAFIVDGKLGLLFETSDAHIILLDFSINYLKLHCVNSIMLKPRCLEFLTLSVSDSIV